jgi:hypothetical protein
MSEVNAYQRDGKAILEIVLRRVIFMRFKGQASTVKQHKGCKQKFQGSMSRLREVRMVVV